MQKRNFQKPLQSNILTTCLNRLILKELKADKISARHGEQQKRVLKEDTARDTISVNMSAIWTLTCRQTLQRISNDMDDMMKQMTQRGKCPCESLRLRLERAEDCCSDRGSRTVESSVESGSFLEKGSASIAGGGRRGSRCAIVRE